MALSSFTIDFTTNQLSLNFSTPVTLTAADLSQFTLQNAASSPTFTVPLTGSTILTPPASMPAATINIELSFETQIRIKSQNTALITRATTYLTTTFPTAVTIIAASYTPDTTSPQLLLCEYFTDTGVLYFTLSKPVITVTPTAITLQNAASSTPSPSRTLTGGTVSRIGRTFYLQLNTADRASLETQGFFTQPSDSYISLAIAAVLDWRDIPNDPVDPADALRCTVGTAPGYTLPSTLSLTSTNRGLTVPTATGLGTANTAGIVTVRDDYTIVSPSSGEFSGGEGLVGPLAYGGNVFVTIDFSSPDGRGIAWTSPDGVSWTQRGTLNTGYIPWSSMAYGGGRFVAVSGTGAGSSNVTATSTDGGMTWTPGTLPVSAKWQGVAYGGGVWVALVWYDDSFSGTTIAATSTDGITWIQRTLPASAFWSSITYGGGVFVAVAQNSTTAATSPDGITWTQRSLPVMADWYNVAYGVGQFVAVAGGASPFSPASNVAATSTDGITWTQRTLPVSTVWSAFTYGNGYFLAVSLSTNPFGPGPGNATYVYSADGITWTQGTMPSNATGQGWDTLAYGAGVFVSVPSQSASGRFDNVLRVGISERNLTQIDGITSISSAANLQVGGGLQGQSLIKGSTGADWSWNSSLRTDAIADIVTVSGDAPPFDPQTSYLPDLAGWLSIAYGANTFVAVGSDSGSSYMATSPDGRNWTQNTQVTSTVPWMNRVIYGGGMFLVKSDNDNTPSLNYAISSDGLNWTLATFPTPPGYPGWGDVGYGSDRFVIVGYYKTDSAYSTDGVNWTAGGNLPSADWWIRVAYGAGTFVALSYDGVSLALSTNGGVSWISGALPAGIIARDLIYADGMFVAVGSSGVATSSDGVSWSLSPTDVGGSSVAWGDGVFMAVSGGSAITSPNGITWTQRSLPDFSFNAVAYGAEAFVVVGGGVYSDPSDVSVRISVPFGDPGALVQGTLTATSAIMAENGLAASGPVSLGAAGNVSIAGGDPGRALLASGSTLSFGFPTTLANDSANVIVASGNSYSVTTASVSSFFSWQTVAYGGGVFVAVAASGTQVFTSPDGTTWTTRSLPVTGTWNWGGLAWGVDQFVLSGYQSISYGIRPIFTSPDGITWTRRSTPADGSTAGPVIAYGAGLFVALYGQSTRVTTSPDGINWTTRTLPVSANWYSVTYGAGTFVAVAYNSNIAASSPDGITWTQRTLPQSALWFSVAYGANTFVAVALSSNIAATSPDGVTWTQRTLPESANWYSVTYGGGVFLLTQLFGRSYTSANGVNWSRSDFGAGDNILNAAYGNGRFVGLSGSAGSISVITTNLSNTATVTGELQISGFGSLGSIANLEITGGSLGQSLITNGDGKLEFSSPQILGLGSTSVVTATAVPGFRSVQGTLSANTSWTGVAYGAGTFVAVSGNSSLSNQAATSVDGITWTARTLPSSQGWSSVAYGAGVFVAVAGHISGTTTVAATSPDGVTWTTRTLPSSQRWSSVTWGANTFVAVSGLSANSTVTATSPDGITWTARTTLPSGYWQSVAWGANTFVAIAGGPVAGTAAATSTNGGVTWTQRALPFTTNWRGLAYGGNTFVALGSSVTAGNVAATSSDGINWTQRTLPVSAVWQSVAYGGGQFVAVASSQQGVTDPGDTAAVSSDGITWTLQALPLRSRWGSIAYGAGRFAAIGALATVTSSNAAGITFTATNLANIAGSLQVSGTTDLGPAANVRISGGSGQQLLGTLDNGDLGWLNSPYSWNSVANISVGSIFFGTLTGVAPGATTNTSPTLNNSSAANAGTAPTGIYRCLGGTSTSGQALWVRIA